MPSLFSKLRGMPHIFEQILSYLDAKDKFMLAIAFNDVRVMLQDFRLFPSLSYEVPLLRRGFVDRQGFWVGNESCFGSLVVVEAKDKFQAMLQLLQDDIPDDPFLVDDLQVSFILARSKEEANNVGTFLTAQSIPNLVIHGPLSPKNTFRIRQHEGLFVVIFHSFEGLFRLSPKIKIIALHVPGSSETYRQVLRVGAHQNICLVAVDNQDQVLRAAKIANYLAYKRDRRDHHRSTEFQRTVVPAGPFLQANLI